MKAVPPSVPPVPPVDWLGIKHTYMYGDGTGKVYGYCSLSKKFGAQEDTIKRRAQREGWAEQRAAVAGKPVPPVPLPVPLLVAKAEPEPEPVPLVGQGGTLLPASQQGDIQALMIQEEVKIRARHFKIQAATAKGLENYLAAQTSPDGKIIVGPSVGKEIWNGSRAALQALNLAVYGLQPRLFLPGVESALNQANESIQGEVLGVDPARSLYTLLAEARARVASSPEAAPDISSLEEPTTLPPHLSSCKNVR